MPKAGAMTEVVSRRQTWPSTGVSSRDDVDHRAHHVLGSGARRPQRRQCVRGHLVDLGHQVARADERTRPVERALAGEVRRPAGRGDRDVVVAGRLVQVGGIEARDPHVACAASACSRIALSVARGVSASGSQRSSISAGTVGRARAASASAKSSVALDQLGLAAARTGELRRSRGCAGRCRTPGRGSDAPGACGSSRTCRCSTTITRSRRLPARQSRARRRPSSGQPSPAHADDLALGVPRASPRSRPAGRSPSSRSSARAGCGSRGRCRSGGPRPCSCPRRW